MKSLIIGASAGLGRALATELAKRGHELFLVASDEADLAPLCTDLGVRFGQSVSSKALNLKEFSAIELRNDVLNEFGEIDNLIVVAGISTKSDKGPVEQGLAQDIMHVNYAAPVEIINAFLPDLEERDGANIVGIGSVAASRPRRGNAIYASAKRGLEFYFGTIRHYLASSSCNIQFYRVGYLKTSMTLGQKLPFPAMEPSVAAVVIAQNLGQDIPVRYLPRWWWVICSILQSVPWPIFKKLDV
jgi:short-subunit dehydrogenase